MPIIAGLGNPGPKYRGTRHNIGFELVDRLSEQLSVKMGPGKGPFHMGSMHRRGEKLILVKPTTYMNLSGDAIRQVLGWYKLAPSDCLVCYDDLNIPAGTIRLRPKGSAGGHNGIKDIIRKLDTEHFPRLRIGIGDEFREGNQVDYVLSKFPKKDRETIDRTLDRACKAALHFVDHGIEDAMNEYN